MGQRTATAGFWVETLLCSALVAAITLSTVCPLSADAAPEAECFLDDFEAGTAESNVVYHKTEMTIRCGRGELSVVGVAGHDLRFLDGGTDLIEVGITWWEEWKAANPDARLVEPTIPRNAIQVTEVGKKHTVEIFAHSWAVPESGTARLEGTVQLVAEKGCIGPNAVEPLTLTTTAGTLRRGDSIPLPGGGEISTSKQGESNGNPMLAIGGGGAYFALVDPPNGVGEESFFGHKRVVIDRDAAEDTAITLRVCPTEVVTVPVSIEGTR